MVEFETIENCSSLLINAKMNAKYCPEIKSRWKSYSTYKLVLWAWMMNELAVVFAPVDMSHNGFYIHSLIYVFAAVFVGIPLVYSEICVAQYTNCNVVSVWDFFPLFRGVSYGIIYLNTLKIIYMMVLTSWYLEYAFHAALDPPPWFSCDDFGDKKCMVKRVNISIFQHCLEAQNLFDDDCGMKTASSCFFEREIGENNTNKKNCVHVWKMMVATCTLGFVYTILSLKLEKCMQIVVRFLAIYICVVIFILFCVALSSSGTWYATKITMNWSEFNYKHCFYTFTRGILSCGTGCGIIGFLSRDVSFRSPATMTSVTICLFSIFITIVLGLILFSGIKTMSYYHGEEENVLEMGESVFFSPFASVSEILSYFDNMALWGFIWFLAIFFCLFVNLWIMILFMFEFIYIHFEFVRKYYKLSLMSLIVIACALSSPFYCSDLTGSLADVTEIIQVTSSLFFSVAIYWLYGYKKHSIDIIFMIGVKASCFWTFLWIVNPILLMFMLSIKVRQFVQEDCDNTYSLKAIPIRLDLLLGYILLSLYVVIVLLGMIIEIKKYHKHSKIIKILSPTENWGPQDKILYRSRKMFVPEIMTREFLYRQVRIRGYSRSKKIIEEHSAKTSEDSFEEKTEWSALTSN